MIYTIKRLIVVLMIALIVFRLAKPIALRFMSDEDYARRRMVWIGLTVVGFLSPSFWLYALIAAPMLYRSGRKDSNPIALYLLMLHVIPPVGFIIPILGNNGLFALDNYRLLAFCVLLPAAQRYRMNRGAGAAGGLASMDLLLLTLGGVTSSAVHAPGYPASNCGAGLFNQCSA